MYKVVVGKTRVAGFAVVQRVKRGWLLRGKPAFHPSIVVV